MADGRETNMNTRFYDDLRWLGLKWETPALKQSEHMERYGKAIGRLHSPMGLLYPCFASRREIREHPMSRNMPKNPDGVPVYPGLYRDLNRCQNLLGNVSKLAIPTRSALI